MQGFGLGLGLSQRGRGGRYSPSILFANGEQGGWYDPSDLTTLFQDAAGTTPVTADGQPVGLALDKSKWGGKTLAQVIAGQPELISNGELTANTNGWTAVNSPIVTTGVNGATIQNNGSTYGFMYQGITTVVGRRYQISVDIDFTGPGFARVDWAGGVPAGVGGNPINVNADGHYSGGFTATTTTTYICVGNRNDNNAVNAFKNVSVKEIPGNHATQATVAKRRAYKTDGTLSWLLDDGSDDALPVTFPNLGANCTVAYASASGVTILTGQTISGAYNLPVTGGNLYGCVIIDRALTPTETQKLTAYLKKKAGL
jgi:hypothetical protein